MNDEHNPPRAIPHPFPRSIEAFEELLKRAETGGIAAFAAIWVDPHGVVGWKFHFGNRPQTDLIGGIACMNWTIIAGAMSPPPPPPPPMGDPPTDMRQ